MGEGSFELLLSTLFICISALKPSTLSFIDNWKPLTIPMVNIITVSPMATPAMAIRTVGRDTFFSLFLPLIIRLAIKYSVFNYVDVLPVIKGFVERILPTVYLFVAQGYLLRCL